MKSIYKNYHIYIGYYKNKIIAVSEDKKVVKYYMENHRGLKKHQYIIEDAYVSDTDMIVKYEDYLIEEYYGFYIPRIDRYIIDMDIAFLADEVSTLIERIKQFIILISHLKKSSNDIQILVSAIKVLSNYTAKKKYKKIRKEAIKSHELLYCDDIDKYMIKVRNYKEMIEMNNAYNNAWVNDN